MTDHTDVSRCRAVIVVCAMRGCPACEDFKPRLEREVERWRAQRAPFVFGERGQVFQPHQVPILFLDANSPDAQDQQLMTDFAVEALPTTIVFTRFALPLRIEGAIDDAQIYAMLKHATS